MSQIRLPSGIPGLDDALGGGFLPGTLVVVVGSTGIGKTQLGIQFANQGRTSEGRPGVIFDMCSRGDSQNHDDYARRIGDWELRHAEAKRLAETSGFFDESGVPGDYLHVFDYSGRRVTRENLDEQGWRDWQAELTRKLGASVGFFYGNFVRGVRRAVVDGIEPVDRPNDSIQIELFDYIYHQILRKDPAWVARDFFREHYRENETTVAEHSYDPKQIVCLLLYTSHETTLAKHGEEGAAGRIQRVQCAGQAAVSRAGPLPGDDRPVAEGGSGSTAETAAHGGADLQSAAKGTRL